MLWGISAMQWSAIGTMATAVIALAAAGFAAAQVLEARRAREDRTRPFVIVDVVPSGTSSHLLTLVVENIGETLAKDVKLTFDPPLETTFDDDHAIEHSAMVTDGIKSMPPGRSITGIFDQGPARDKSDLPVRYDVTVELSDARGRTQEPLTYVLDLAPMFGLMFAQELGIHHAAKALQNIDKRTKQWTKLNQGLKVWMRDADRDREDDRSEEFLTGRRPTLGTSRPHPAAIALGRNPLLRLLVETIPPLHRWLQQRLAQNDPVRS